MHGIKMQFTMVRTVMLIAVFLTTAVSGGIQAKGLNSKHTKAMKEKENILLNFENVPVGKLPAEWMADATRLRGPMETWQVISDRSAPSGSHVLGMTSPNHRFGGTFNICWTHSISFMDGEITVRFKALKGRGDQGGGIMWRVRDRNNYYVARFNPLEDNFCVYSVIQGVRRILGSATIKLPAGKWHTMKIVQKGSHFEGYLNGKKLLQGNWSKVNASGGVGMWTKADAVTSFDDFSVRLVGHNLQKQVK